MNAFTNNRGIGLALAVWLAHDDYDAGTNEHPGKNVISATTLLKSTRSFILSNRVPPEQNQVDIADRITSRLGHAIHDSIETSWRKGYREAMKSLGYPQKVIDKVVINPEAPTPDAIPVYLEQRYFREINVDGYPFVISGKFDYIINGELNDTKTTSVYTWIRGNKTDDYRIQGSIYRWINPDKVTSDVFRIQHIFKDFQASMAKPGADYPASQVLETKIELMSLEETETFIRSKIREILANQSKDEPDLIRCSDRELWMSDPQYKYYSDPAKAALGGRSTKNFPNYPAAAAWLNKQGKGTIVTVPAAPKACRYCAGFSVCSQAQEYEANRQPEDEAEDA